MLRGMEYTISGRWFRSGTEGACVDSCIPSCQGSLAPSRFHVRSTLMTDELKTALLGRGASSPFGRNVNAYLGMAINVPSHGTPCCMHIILATLMRTWSTGERLQFRTHHLTVHGARELDEIEQEVSRD